MVIHCMVGTHRCQAEISDRQQGFLTEDHDDAGTPSEQL